LDQLRELFACQCERDGNDRDLVAADVAAGEVDVEDYWQRGSWSF
jgi:hypothetical protein